MFVVDDDLATREAVDAILRSVGYNVTLFPCGTGLIEQLEDDFDGCVVLDVRLPGPSGLEIQRSLSDKGICIPIVFMTGYGDVAMAVQAMKGNAVDFLTKPVRDQDLLDAVNIALQRSKEIRDRRQLRADAQARIKLLSPRETEVFSMLCQGFLTKQIAPELAMSQATVKVHRRNIMQKLEITRNAEHALS